MELTFLGTSSGTPTRQRNVTALALGLERGRGWYLVDCGEATQHQVLRTPLSLHELRAVFVTHVHGDHCYGLPGLLASAGMGGREAPLPIVGPPELEAWIRATLAHTALHLPFEPRFIPVDAAAPWEDEAVRVEAVPLSHRVPSHGFAFTEARPAAQLDTDRLRREGIPPGPLWGRLQKGEELAHEGRVLRGRDYLRLPHPPRKVVVGGDNDRPELLREACRDAQVLVHEATYTRDVAERSGAQYGHSSAAQVADFAEAAGLPNLVLTHFSPRYQPDPAKSPSIADLRAEAEARYRGRLFLAEDFARYRLSREGALTLTD